MPQYAVPTSDINKTNWLQYAGDNDASAFDELDEGIAGGTPDGDTTAWQTASGNGVTYTIECGLGSVTDPNSASGHVMRAYVSKNTTLTFAGVGRVSGGTGLLVDALLIDSANQATKPSLELWLFSTAPAMDNDNAVFTPTDAELAALLGIIQFQTAFVGDATAGAGGNSVIPSERTYLPVYLKCASTVTAIYGVLVTRSAYTPVSGEIFTVILKVVQD